MFSWIVAIGLGLIAWLFMKVVTKPIRRSLTGREPRMTDKLSEYGGSLGADCALGPVSEEGVARLYERMCVLEPNKWEDDPRIPGIVKRYKAIVSGREADPDGCNVPSATILDAPNPDYSRYLRNQRKAVGSTGLKVAAKWARQAEKEQEIRAGFGETLLKMGMPEGLIEEAITDERLDSYTDEQWRAVVKSMRTVSDRYGEELALNMLRQFPEADVLCSPEAAETFDALCRQDIPFEVSRSVVCGDMTVGQAEAAAALVEDWDYTWAQAVKEVREKDAREVSDSVLRDKYIRKVNPRAKVRG